MKVQRFCLRSFLQHFLLCCVISSLLCCSFSFDSYAASTNVAADQNGDGQITADEVDLAQLATYGLVTGYGVTGEDVPGLITSSAAYLNALAESDGIQSTVLIGTLADGKLTFGDWFQNLCTNIYAELTDSTVVGYTVFPAISKSAFFERFNEYFSAGTMSSSEYMNAYNAFNDSSIDFTGAFYWQYLPNGNGEIVLGLGTTGDDFCLVASSDGYYLGAISYNGTTFSTSNYGSTKHLFGFNKYRTGYSGKAKYHSDSNYECGIIDMPLVVFNTIADYTRFVSSYGSIYFSSNAARDCNYRNDNLNTLNAYDWSVLSGLIYNHTVTAVTDSNATTVQQIQSVIDQELSDLSEFIIEQESGTDDPEEDPGTEGDQESVLGDKLDQNNALQEENNQLQQESNQLQEENNALQEESNQLQEESNALQEEENETSKGILGKITEFFGSFFQNLIDSVVGIFVPDQEDMQANFERLDQFFSDTFGFLYYPFDFLIEVINIFLNADSSTGLVFPGFSIMGYEVWGDISFDLTSIEIVNTVFETVRLITGGVLAFMFIQYLRNFFDKRFGGGGA